jgi:hypothetical protein
MDEKENYAQFKEVSKNDEEVVLARLMSETFSIDEEASPAKTDIEFESKQYPVATLTV